MAEYVTCPNCGSKVLSAETFLGQRVRCFGCDARFLASADSERPPSLALENLGPRAPLLYDRELPEDEDRPFCPGCGRQVQWQDSVCPHCGEEFEEGDRPPLRAFSLQFAEPSRRDCEPHRGRLLYALGAVTCVLGVVSFCTFGISSIVALPLGAVVWVMATHDLQRMREGVIDPSGRTLTQTGRSTAFAGVAFGIVFGGLLALMRF